jgi:hypothetical protein
MVVDRESSCPTSFSHTAAPRGDAITCNLVCRHQRSVAGRARAAGGDNFATSGGDDMVVLRLVVATDNGEGGSRRIECW